MTMCTTYSSQTHVACSPHEDVENIYFTCEPLDVLFPSTSSLFLQLGPSSNWMVLHIISRDVLGCVLFFKVLSLLTRPNPSQQSANLTLTPTTPLPTLPMCLVTMHMLSVHLGRRSWLYGFHQC